MLNTSNCHLLATPFSGDQTEIMGKLCFSFDKDYSFTEQNTFFTKGIFNNLAASQDCLSNQTCLTFVAPRENVTK